MPNKIEKLQKTLTKGGFPSVECRESRKSVVLEGELAEYKDIVKAGKTAAKYGYKGVVNNIALKNYIPERMSVPGFEDNSLDGLAPDVLIIGGGVIGCMIARELSKYKLSILLAEKESDVAMHASSRNDGMNHPGVASHPGSIRGTYNVRGNAMYEQLARELGITYKKTGALILFKERPLARLAGFAMMNRCKNLGIEGRNLNREELLKIEPEVTDTAVGAHFNPNSGMLSPYKLVVALAEHAIQNGARISLNTVVKGMATKHEKIAGVMTNRGTLRPKVVINAAGCFADKIAAMAGDQFFSIHPRKGEIVILDKKKGHIPRASMGMLKLSLLTSDSKGGGLMPTADGNVLVGPDAYEIPEREDFSTNKENIDKILKTHLNLVKGLEPSDAIAYLAGIRAPTYEEEFVIEKSEYIKNLVHAAGIQSPGLASAPAIAEDIAKFAVEILSGEMQVLPNEKYNPNRIHKPAIAGLPIEEKQKIIKQNPDYGIIVCRCEEISKGEIIDAIKAPLPALSIDAVKRRVRPGMGRCQGGFCSPLVTKLISENAGISEEEITKSGGGSNLFFGKTNKGII
ncbi:MAG: NAD(P)/FAD-dependent oxidoreductase [Oscillospiraceae bacterium]|nr:NAD(P)/FAD-dependent oxidoreductase [Oscillospiraceae bacterium]